MYAERADGIRVDEARALYLCARKVYRIEFGDGRVSCARFAPNNGAYSADRFFQTEFKRDLFFRALALAVAQIYRLSLYDQAVYVVGQAGAQVHNPYAVVDNFTASAAQVNGNDFKALACEPFHLSRFIGKRRTFAGTRIASERLKARIIADDLQMLASRSVFALH